MKKLIFAIASIFLITSYSLAQTKAKTENGREVILNKDGTWKFINEKSLNTNSDKFKNRFGCKNLIETREDKVTGDVRTIAKAPLIVSDDGGKTGFSIAIFKAREQSIIFPIEAAGAGNCIDERSKVNILYRDGTRAELYTNNSFNCNGQATIYMGGMFGKSKELQNLASKEIETLRVWTSDSYVEKDFTKEQSQQLLYTAKCILE